MESQITWGGIGEEEEEAIVLVHQTKPGDVEAVSPVIIVVDLSHNRSWERFSQRWNETKFETKQTGGFLFN